MSLFFGNLLNLRLLRIAILCIVFRLALSIRAIGISSRLGGGCGGIRGWLLLMANKAGEIISVFLRLLNSSRCVCWRLP